MRNIFTIVLITLIQTAFSQEVVQSIGLRAGGGNGFAYKYIEDYNYAVEGIVSYRDNGFQLTGLWERYKPFMTERINHFYFYWGIGAHAGYLRVKDQYCVQDGNSCALYESKRTKVIAGMDGTTGFEYQFYSVPMAISLDYKPYFEFFGEDFFRIDFWNFGLTFKYTF